MQFRLKQAGKKRPRPVPSAFLDEAQDGQAAQAVQQHNPVQDSRADAEPTGTQDPVALAARLKDEGNALAAAGRCAWPPPASLASLVSPHAFCSIFVTSCVQLSPGPGQVGRGITVARVRRGGPQAAGLFVCLPSFSGSFPPRPPPARLLAASTARAFGPALLA